MNFKIVREKKKLDDDNKLTEHLDVSFSGTGETNK